MKHLIFAMLSLVALLTPPRAPAADQSAEQGAADRPAMEKALAERLSNSRLSGFYVIDGKEGPPQQDQYTLGKVEKQEGDKWLIHARIEYGKKSVNVPLEVPIFWAGDAAVISVTNFTIPGLGSYTARVMIHGDRYAGTWSAGETHGGFLWGRIQHVPADNQTLKPDGT